MSKRRILTEAEMAQVLKMRRDGVNVHDIATRAKVSRDTVSLFLRDPMNYLENAEKGLKPTDVTPVEIEGIKKIIPRKKLENTSTPVQASNKSIQKPKIMNEIPISCDSSDSTDSPPRKRGRKISILKRKPTPETKKFYHLKHKYRAIIEYLTRISCSPTEIQKRLNDIYGKTIELPLIQFWSAPYTKLRVGPNK